MAEKLNKRKRLVATSLHFPKRKKSQTKLEKINRRFKMKVKQKDIQQMTVIMLIREEPALNKAT